MKNSLITEPLGLYGWSHLEPVVLAALASEEPMLLIGKHGSAKSFILERLAQSLDMKFRCYNASLINYDDLVGIPVPVNNNTSLSYISNPSSIWDAEVVFIDELNRTKPELQNKLFPIIYDRRVQGINLSELKYRWAAMNPPCKDDDDTEDSLSYIGAMPLDPALADRFPFIIEVPTWDDLNDEDKQRMLTDNHMGRHEFPVDIHKLIDETKHCYKKMLETEKEKTDKYIITLMSLLKNSFGYFSSRRATMMEESLLYLLAATNVINGHFDLPVSFMDVAYLHIQNTIPNIANEVIDKVLLMNICQQALKLSNLNDSVDKDILLISNPIERLKKLIKNKTLISNEIANDTITTSLGEMKDEKKRRAMALFTYLAFRGNHKINAAVIETLANEIRPVLETKTSSTLEYLRIKRCADVVVSLMHSVENEKYYNYLNNYLCSYLPDQYVDEAEPKVLFAFFIEMWKELGL